MNRYDIVFRDATVCDGTGAPARPADVAVAGQRIAAVGPSLPGAGEEEIDASGLTLTPGFIDAHTHSEIDLLDAPQAASKILQGVTTEIIGNCGGGCFPSRGAHADDLARGLARRGLQARWETIEGYVDTLERARPTVNVVALVPFGAVRCSTMGFDTRPPTAAEIRRMRRDVEEHIAFGCAGISTGLACPGQHTATEEEVISVVSDGTGISSRVYATHMRSEDDSIEEAVEESITIARESRLRLQISHLKIAEARNWHKIDWLVERLERARQELVGLGADRYPYLAGMQGLIGILPSSAYDGGREAILGRLRNGATRERLVEETLAEHPEPDYWERVLISSVSKRSLESFEGMRIAAIATDRGVSGVEAAFDLLVEDECRTMAIYFTMREENLERILRLPFVMIGSDASACTLGTPSDRGKAHPRTFGAHARILERYVRERKILSLEEAVHKMSGLVAEQFGMDDRGRVREDLAADLLAFDPGKVREVTTFEDPNRYAEGISHVMVNGRFAVRDGKLTGERSGHFLPIRRGTEVV